MNEKTRLLLKAMNLLETLTITKREQPRVNELRGILFEIKDLVEKDPY